MDGVERLRDTVASKGLVALVGCQWRYHPCVRWLRDLLQAGQLGPPDERRDRLRRVPCRTGTRMRTIDSSYAARAELGGGVVLTQIHDYDLAWWLFGPPSTVTASGGHLSAPGDRR